MVEAPGRGPDGSISRGARRAGGAEIAAFELLLPVVVGDLIQQGVTQEDMTVTGAVLAVGTIGAWILLFSYLGFRFRPAPRPAEPRTLASDVYAVILTYTGRMKRLQIYIEPEMDAVLEREAARTGVSKASIIRRLIAAYAGDPAPDPIDELVGRFPEAPGSIDDVVYGR